MAGRVWGLRVLTVCCMAGRGRGLPCVDCVAVWQVGGWFVLFPCVYGLCCSPEIYGLCCMAGRVRGLRVLTVLLYGR